MAKAKQKFYVVWKGRNKGIFTNWTDCEQSVKGYPDAKFKSFKSMDEAAKAYEDGHEIHISNSNKQENESTHIEIPSTSQSEITTENNMKISTWTDPNSEEDAPF